MWCVDPFLSSIEVPIKGERSGIIPCSSDYNSAIKDTNLVKSAFFDESVCGDCAGWSGSYDGHASNVVRHFVRVCCLPLLRLKLGILAGDSHRATGRNELNQLSQENEKFYAFNRCLYEGGWL